MAKEYPQSLMLYWSPKTADDILGGENPLDHVVSNQLRRASAGDTVWVVTVYNGELFLLGKLSVAEVTSRRGAVERLGRPDVWGNREYYAVADKSTMEPLKKVPLRSVVEKITFQSATTRGKTLDLGSDGRINAQQLQTMRILTGSSVVLFQDMWSGD